jgi:nucleotide-binding universal stress UspA family protein
MMRNLLTIPQRSRQSTTESLQLGVAFNKVLAVVTGSSSDEGVLAHAADLVRPVKGRLHILYVIEVDRSLPVDAEIGPAAAKGEDVLRGVEEIIKLPKNEFDAHMVQAREIGPAVVSEAISREVDALVIGSHFPRENGSFSLGRDIPFILEHAPCLVVLRREAPPRTRGRRSTSSGFTPNPGGLS